ncbi:hypothetical protein CDIK_1207 [Cucumispora dikerogammari]|nr:hypothetical protein CDIK_1207 [Cucumispora dikerogammari]
MKMSKKIINIFKKRGCGSKKKSGCWPVILTESILNKIENYILENPDSTFREVKNKLVQSEPAGFNISISTIVNALRKFKITVKKLHRELDRANLPNKILARKE